MTNHRLFIFDDLSPEDLAMLQALYSRSGESVATHIEKVRAAGSGKFMQSYYVGYNHKSIADCGTTTMFIENVSLLAAKAIQDWPLYSGQETSTRYIDMSKRDIVDPINTPESAAILQKWMNFYIGKQGEVADLIRKRYPIKDGEKPEVYEKAVKARTFDTLRGFLPAGITTQLSWHTNLRQAGDHLLSLVNHPSPEIQHLSKHLNMILDLRYPSSGFGTSTAAVSGVGNKDAVELEKRKTWEAEVAKTYTYQPPNGYVVHGEHVAFRTDLQHYQFEEYQKLFDTRPRGCVLPHFLTDLGLLHFDFNLDFGSFRDIQRHRNGVCRMPLLTTSLGFEPWYLDQLGGGHLLTSALNLINDQTWRINDLTTDPVLRQYYTALGYRVHTSLTYGLPAAAYVMELRSGKMIHPSLRKKVHSMIACFRTTFPQVRLHVDLDPDDWDVRRGTQTITKKE